VTTRPARRDLPTGTVTLLFTDVEGSTDLLQELGERYAESLGEHRRLVRDVVARHGGVEVDTQGDAFFIVFETATNALAAASEIQSATSMDDRFRIRIGVHTGEPRTTNEGYVGIDVHRAARITAAGHGGQTLVSQSTRELVDGEELRDLGTHRLKDVGELRLYQLGDEPFPPLRSLNQTNVPLSPTPLLGRKRELADLLRLLGADRSRLVTILGPGGIGKTRLALEVAAELVTAFEDGASFADLSPIHEPDLVEPAIAAALDVGSPVADHLRQRELLLVLDNLEQVVGVATELGALLEACPRVAILATSREPLHLRAEVEYPLKPLAEAPAVELFRQRAQEIEPEFEAEYLRLAELCERLDRMPLAIELAAARVKVLSTDELLTRLDRRLPLLTGGARDAPARQRTLRATIEWSYELLTDDEKRLFGRLAVFEGGWTLDAAEEVCDADLDTMQSLVEKSLVRADSGRFRMLETIREYALEQFAELPDSDELRSRHAEHFLALAVRAEPELTAADQLAWHERLVADYENLRASLAWFLARDDGGAALQLASALVLFWFNRGLYRDGLHWLELVLHGTPGEKAPSRAGALWGAGFLWSLIGDAELAKERLEEGLALARELGAGVFIARSLAILGLLSFFENDIRQARAFFEEGIEAARTAGDQWGVADSLGTLASIYPLQGEFDLADEVGREALALGRELGDRQGVRMANFALALTAARRGELKTARELSEDGLAICRELGDLWFVSYFLWILSTTATEAGDYDAAREQAEESLKIARELEGPLLIVCALDAMALAVRAADDDAAARQLLTEAVELGRTAIVPDSYVASALRSLGEVAAALGDVSEADACFEEALSRADGVDDRWVAARVKSSQASVAQGRGEREFAEALARDALALQRELGDQLGVVETLERLASIVAGYNASEAASLFFDAAPERGRLGAPLPPWRRDELATVEEAVRAHLDRASS
jgi:predicted ATPase/class 3 adenylate cyclase